MNQTTRTAIVTGAGSGIGRASALALVQAGYRVALVGRRISALEETQALAGDAADRCLPVSADLCNEESTAAMFDKVQQEFGHLDVIFNNAGISAPNVLLEDLTLQQWQDVVNVNLTGVFLCTQHAIRIMKQQDPMGGRIINNGSISAHVPRPNSAPYTATKHAVSGLTRSTSLDCRKYNIACGQIDIGNASTDMTSGMSQGVQQANGSVAQEPTMDVQCVADAVVYMANLPLSANVQFMTVMATTMPYIGRG